MPSPNTYTHMTHKPTLDSCIELIRGYIGKLDLNGRCIFDDYLAQCKTDEDKKELLQNALLSRFQYDIIENSGTSHDPIETENLEDRVNSITDTLHHCSFYSNEIFCEQFIDSYDYALFNIHPDTKLDTDR